MIFACREQPKKEMKFNRLIPELVVKDFDKSLDFYVNQLGFVIDFERKEDKFAQISYQGSQIMLNQDNGDWITAEPVFPRGRGINFQIETDNLDDIEQKISLYHIPYFVKTKEQWYRIDQKEEGVKEFLIQDLDGYLLRFQQYLGEREWKK